MENLKPMGDWCMAKDYNGAENFLDGTRPLLAGMKYADIVVSGHNTNNKDERVLVGVYPTVECGGLFYEGLAANMAQGVEIGETIAEHIKNGFDRDSFSSYFKSIGLFELNIG